MAERQPSKLHVAGSSPVSRSNTDGGGSVTPSPDAPPVPAMAVVALRRRMSGRVIRAVGSSPALRRVTLAFLAFNGALYGTWVAMLVWAYEATGPASVGLVALVQLLPAGALAPVSAALADRYPRDRVLLAGYLFQTVAFGATATGMLLGAPPALVYLAGAVLAFAATFARPAQGALLPTLARTPEELTAANSAVGTAEGLGVLIGPLAAAVMLALTSPGVVWLAGAAMAALAATLVVRLAGSRTAMAAAHPERQLAHDTAGGSASESDLAESAWSLVVGGLQAVLRSPHTRLVVALLGVRMLCFGAVDVLFVLLALEVYGTGGGGAALLSGALGLGLVLGGAASMLLVGRQRMAPALALSSLVWGVPLLLVASVSPGAWALVLIAVAGIGFAIIDVAGRTVLQRVTPDRQLARVLGALEGIGLVFLSLGSLIAPHLAARAGTMGALAVVGLLLPVAVLASWLALSDIDRHVNVPVRAIALMARNAVLAPLRGPQLEAVARKARWMTASAGEVLIREGDVGDRYFVLETGEFRVEQGGMVVGRLAGVGEGVGEIALLHGVRRTATVVAGTPSVLLTLERADFLQAVTGHSEAQGAATAVADARRASDTGPGRAAGGPG